MSRWELLEPVVVRTAGLPVTLLEQLRMPRTTAAVRRLVVLERELDRRRAELLGDAFPAAVSAARRDQRPCPALRALSRARRDVGRRRPPAPSRVAVLPDGLREQVARWAALCARRDDLETQVHACFADEQSRARATLYATVRRADVREALFMLNPAMHAALERRLGEETPPPLRSGARQFERRLIIYLQRLCMKNETHSFVGPVDYGRVDAAASANLRLRRSAAKVRRREVFPSQWMAERIAAKVSAESDLRPWLRPRRATTCALADDGSLWFPGTTRRARLDAAHAALFTAADGTATVRDLAAGEWEVTWERVQRLADLNALVTALVPPANTADPLGWVADRLGELPGDHPTRRRWVPAIARLRSLLDAFAQAALPRRVALLRRIEDEFTGLCGDVARRGAGQMYADRGVLFEECLGDLEECTIGGDLARAIREGLQPLLQLGEVRAHAERDRDWRAAVGVLRRRLGPDRATVPLLTYLADFASHGPQDHTGTPDGPAIAEASDGTGGADGEARLVAELRALVGAHGDRSRVHLSARDLPRAPITPGLVTSVDLLVAAPGARALSTGDFRVVLGEVHPGALTWVFPTGHFLGDRRAALDAALHEALRAPPDESPAWLAGRRHTKIYPYPLPGLAVELRPTGPMCRGASAGAVHVGLRDGLPRLRDGDTWLRLPPPLSRRDGPDPVAALCAPAVVPPVVRTGAHTPRLEVDGVVYQRERWELDQGPDPADDDADRLLAAWRWKRHYGMPREVFVRVPNEPKPVFVDFDNFFLVDLLARMTEGSEPFTVIEALPSTRELWLERDGEAHCCELRITATTGPPPGPGAAENDHRYHQGGRHNNRHREQGAPA